MSRFELPLGNAALPLCISHFFLYFKLLTPTGNDRGPAFTESMLKTLYAADHDRRGVAFRIDSHSGETCLAADVPPHLTSVVVHELQDSYPGLEVKRLSRPPSADFSWTCELRKHPDVFQLRPFETFTDETNRREFADPLSGVLSAMQSGRSGRLGFSLELTIRPATKRRLKSADRIREILTRGFRLEFAKRLFLRLATSDVFFVRLLAHLIPRLNAAKRLELVERNAFDSEVSSSRPNRSRDFFVTAEMTSAILEACPDVQWRLMFALWRLAALRKMEIFELRWDHILWDQGKMLVPSPKTARHLGRENRFVPLGGIEPYLRSAFDAANDGVERVITRYSESNCNLDKPFGKILMLAGYRPWPKLFQNLRSSCETEWLDSGFPAHVVACWVGHTVNVQNDHYAQIDQHHFEDFNSKVGEKVAHKVAHTLGELGRMPANDYEKRPAKNQCFRGPSSQFVTMRGNSDAPERGNNSAVSPAFQNSAIKSGAHSGALSPVSGLPACPESLTLADIWNELSDEAKSEVLKIAEDRSARTTEP